MKSRISFFDKATFKKDITHHLQFQGVALHIRKTSLNEHFSVVHNAHVVADVFQFPEFV